MKFDPDTLLNYLRDKLDVETELKNGPIPIPRGGETEWTPGKVMALVCNPIYAGVPPFPAEVDDDKWIELMSRFVDRYGAKLVFRVLLDSVRQTYTDFPFS
jgi:hypothetical protein